MPDDFVEAGALLSQRRSGPTVASATIAARSVYEPSRDLNGQDIDNGEWIDRAMNLLAEIGGGATQRPPSKAQLP